MKQYRFVLLKVFLVQNIPRVKLYPKESLYILCTFTINKFNFKIIFKWLVLNIRGFTNVMKYNLKKNSQTIFFMLMISATISGQGVKI